MTSHDIERRVRLLSAYTVALTAALGGIILTGLGSAPPAPSVPHPIDTLRADVVIARMIEVDDRGVTRVRIGGRLPDAVVGGRRLDRGDDIAGVILYDADGSERSGYGTFDDSGNVILTLDAADRQTAFFVAEPTGATALRMWNRDDAIDLRVDGEGARVSLLDSHRVVLQQPEIAPDSTSETCRTLRQLAEEHGTEPLRNACQGRMTRTWCTACLGGVGGQ